MGSLYQKGRSLSAFFESGHWLCYIIATNKNKDVVKRVVLG